MLGHDPIAGYPVDHGTVADEAAMLALHTLDSATLLAEPTFVAPGDSCLRDDDPGWRWHCIAGNGQALANWERRPLAGALTAAAPLVSPALTGTPTAPTASAGTNTAQIASTAFVAAAIAASGGGGGGGAMALLSGGVLGADAASISITGIASTHRHLKLELSLRGTVAAMSTTLRVRCNADITASDYRGSRAAIQNGTFYHAQNAGTDASLVFSCEVVAASALADSYTGYEITVWEYAQTKLKTARAHGGYVQASAAANYLIYDAIGAWLSTAAITQLDITLANGQLAAGSSWRLYGLS